MKGIININGVIGLIPDENGQPIEPNTTFLDVVNQAEAIEATEIDVFINSEGGLVEESDLMHTYLESLKAKGIVINTFAEDTCMSAAVKLFLTGSKRVVNDYTNFMIHNPWGGLDGDADELEAYSKELRVLEKNMADLYSQVTGTSLEAIKPLMKAETFLTPDQVVQLGFATEKAVRIFNAVAFSKRINSNLNTSNSMAKDALTKTEAEGLIDKLIKAFSSKKKEDKPRGLKIVLDANAGEIEFPNLEPDDTPSVGDETTAEDGEFVMPSGETYVVADGVLTEIKPAEDDDSKESEELAAANQKIAELEQQLSEAQAKQKQAEDQVQSMKSEFKSYKKELKKIKAAIGSGFEHDSKRKDNKSGSESKTRNLLKEDQD